MAKAQESSTFVSVGCSLDEFTQRQENKNKLRETQDVSLLKKEKEKDKKTTTTKQNKNVSAFFRLALYFLDVRVLRYFPLLLNLHLVLL